MSSHVVLLSIPGLRLQDLAQMPRLSELAAQGEVASLTANFPALTWTTQANMLTGKTPSEHGVIANGFYWRDTHEVEMWTAWNDKIERPQVWDRLHQRQPPLESAVWFPMLSKGSGADYVCMPAPVHNPDGSESLWCYTKPQAFYAELLERLGHFPLKHFWGPLASIDSSRWIAAARRMKSVRRGTSRRTCPSTASHIASSPVGSLPGLSLAARARHWPVGIGGASVGVAVVVCAADAGS